MSKPNKVIPKFSNEMEERAFWEKHDSTEYLDWTKAKRVVLPDLKPMTKKLNPPSLALQREPFDYTQWRQNIDAGERIEDVSRKAMARRGKQVDSKT